MQLFLELELELEGTRNSFFCLADKKSLSSRVSLFFLVEETVLTILQKNTWIVERALFEHYCINLFTVSKVRNKCNLVCEFIYMLFHFLRGGLIN